MLLFILLEAATMYGSVSQYDGHARALVKASSTHFKGASIFLMYDYHLLQQWYGKFIIISGMF